MGHKTPTIESVFHYFNDLNLARIEIHHYLDQLNRLRMEWLLIWQYLFDLVSFSVCFSPPCTVNCIILLNVFKNVYTIYTTIIQQFRTVEILTLNWYNSNRDRCSLPQNPKSRIPDCTLWRQTLKC